MSPPGRQETGIAVLAPQRNRPMRALVFALIDVLNPVPIEPLRRMPPGIVDPRRHGREWELLRKIDVAIGNGAAAKNLEQRATIAADVILRHRWIMLPRATQKKADVAPVFAQQRIRIVFRVTLEEDKQRAALLVAGERIDTGD